MELKLNEMLIASGVSKKEMADKLWPEASDHAKYNNIGGLCSGKRHTIRIEWIQTICETCGCTPNDLFR